MDHIPKILVTPLHSLFESNLTMAINAGATTLFLGNLYHSIKLLYRNKKKPIYILNFTQSLVGFFVNMFTLTMFFYFDRACSARIYISQFGQLVSFTMIELILLFKAKLAVSHLNYSVLITYFGFFVEATRVAIGICNILTIRTVVTPLFNCAGVVNKPISMTNLAMELTVNAYLSVIFLNQIYSQFKFVKTRFYRTLLKDGLIYSFFTALTSMVVLILVLFKVLNSNSIVLFNISWCMASFLTCTQLRHAYSLKSKDQSYYTNGSSNSGSRSKESANKTGNSTYVTMQPGEENQQMYKRYDFEPKNTRA